MSRERTTATQTVSPVKLAIIAVLTLVLVLVLVYQFSGETAEPAALLKRRTPRDSASAGDSSASDANRATNSNRIHWPDIHRDEVAAFNPFEIPAALRDNPTVTALPAQPSQSVQVVQTDEPPRAEPASSSSGVGGSKPEDEQARIRAQDRKSRLKRIEATATALRQKGVAVVMTTATGAVARVGDQEVRVGDVINGVVRVKEITPHGIVIEEAVDELLETKSN